MTLPELGLRVKWCAQILCSFSAEKPKSMTACAASDRSDQGTFLFQSDGKHDRLAGGVPGRMSGDPGFSRAILIRMRDIERGVGNRKVAGQSLDGAGVGKRKRAQRESAGKQGRLHLVPAHLL
jgi:hypothetical protein